MIIFRKHLSGVRSLTPITNFTLIGTAAVMDRFRVVHGKHDVEYELSFLNLQKKISRSFCLETFYISSGFKRSQSVEI